MATVTITSVLPARQSAPYWRIYPLHSAARQAHSVGTSVFHIMFIRQIHYLLALSKTGHFGRAAEICDVSQPALSTAIQHLEEELGITIVRRGQRFQGFTTEGERSLQWAQILAHDWECMRQEAAQCNRQLTGTLRIGAIPTTLAVTPLLTEDLSNAIIPVSASNWFR